MREGDYLVAIGERDVKWSSHSEVVTIIREAENTLKLRLVTPLDRSLVKLSKDKTAKSALCVHSSLSSPSSTTSSSSGLSMSAGPASSEDTFSPSSSESGKGCLLLWMVSRVNIYRRQLKRSSQLQQEILAENLQHEAERQETVA